MVLALAFAAGVSVRVHVDLAAEYRLDAGGVAGVVELDAAEHDAVVCYRDGVHPHLLRRGCERGAFVGPVEKAVFRMYVKMYEWFI